MKVMRRMKKNAIPNLFTTFAFWVLLAQTGLLESAGESAVPIVPVEMAEAPGGATVLSAHPQGDGPFAWQWRWNGIPIPGQTNARVLLPDQFQNAGDYDVEIESATGRGLSQTVHYEPKPVWNDQIALRYRLDRPASAGAPLDATGNSSATLIGAAGLPQPAPAGAGQPFESGWDFSNAASHPVIASGSALKSLGDVRRGSGLSLCFWVRMPATLPKAGRLGQQIQSDQSIAGMNQFLYLVPTGDGGIYCQFAPDYYTPYAAYTTKSLADGAWHQVVFSCDFRSGMIWQFVDGVRQKIGKFGQSDFDRITPGRYAAASMAVDEALHLGADGKGKKPWKGGLADFMIFTKPIKDDEAKSLFHGGPGYPGKSPLASPAPYVRIIRPKTVLKPEGADSVTVKVRALAANLHGPVTYSWANGYHVSKEMMTIANGKSSEATVTLHGVGDFGIVCRVANGGKQVDEDFATFKVVPNLPPTVGAIECSASAMPAGVPHTVSLKTMVNDDRMPNPPAFTQTAWSQVSGPAPVTFSRPWSARTDAVIPGQPGEYQLRLTADDGAATGRSEITLTVGGTAGVNLTAEARNHTLDLGVASQTTIFSKTDDDAKVSAWHWRQVSGPSKAVLVAPDAPTTPVKVDAIGQYLFEVTATTPEGTQTATTWVNAWQPGGLMVNAGSSRLAWLPNATLKLLGKTSASSSATVHWSFVGGSGTVTFGSPDSLATTAMFSAAGTYELQLDVTDGSKRGQDRLVVEVYRAGDTFGGYSAQELAGYTADLQINYDTTGLDWSRVKPAPAPGVHPRILFNPEDVPDLRRRLKEGTQVGPVILAKIRESAAGLKKGELAKLYQSVAEGDIQPFLVPRAPANDLMHALVQESFRALIDDDAAAEKEAAKAVAAIAEYLGQVVAPNARENLKTYDTKDWRVLYGLHAENIAWCYDFLAPVMTPAQRASVRRLLVRTTDQLPVMGLRVLPGPNANNSNWLPLTSQGFLFTVLAIEGEEGSDPNAIRAYAASVCRQTRALGWPDGTLSEGGGKGWLGSQQYLALAKRGYHFAASDTFRNYLRQFLLQCMVPEGYGFTMDEMNGGTANKGQFTDDYFVGKFLYPNDPLVDFVFRNAYSTTGEDPAGYHAPFRGGHLLAAICAENFQSKLSWSEALAQQIRPVVPKTCWFPYKGLLLTRSDWTPDATRLYFQPRSMPGGHTNPDRNGFVLHALGRSWVPMFVYQSGSGHVEGDSSMPTSIVRVDDRGSGDAPSGEVDVFDSARLTCATGDARDAYRAGSQFKDAPGEIIPYTFNQKHLFHLQNGWADLPAGNLPGWYFSQKQNREWGVVFPKARAFRTAALIRPKTPGDAAPAAYVVMADDIQMDDKAHNYKWRMMLDRDLRGREKPGENEVVYLSPDGTSGLLVRLLKANSPAKFITDNRYKYFDCPWLDISTDTVAPDFRVLLLPFKPGRPLPQTRWQGDVLTVDHGKGGVDKISFARQPGGWTKIRLAE